jgi:hypothetical protein
MLQTLEKLAGNLPRWELADALRESAPAWLRDEAEHRAACKRERDLYEQIGELNRRLSDSRERAKLDKLKELSMRGELVIAFDSRVLTLEVFRLELRKAGIDVDVFTGRGGSGSKRRAQKMLGLGTSNRSAVALCSDALSEGLNLQAASRVVHLNSPTVIRAAEQRSGRVDRMDSPHDMIETWWPEDPPAFVIRRSDLLRERHKLVSDFIGANLSLPGEGDQSEVVRPDEVAGSSGGAANDRAQDLFDAFSSVKDMIGKRGLVSDDLYDQMRTSQADITACVSIVPSAAAWAFLVVGARQRMAPRWIWFDEPSATPLYDLGQVATRLRERLLPGTPDLQDVEAAQPWIERFVNRLSETERLLLPVRRRRALDLAEAVLGEYLQQAWYEGDEERRAVVQAILQMVTGQVTTASDTSTGAVADPRSVADAWLNIFRPRLRALMAKRGGRRKRLARLSDLKPSLLKEPVPTADLRRRFENIPMLAPAPERIIAMIIGVPDPA